MYFSSLLIGDLRECGLLTVSSALPKLRDLKYQLFAATEFRGDG